MDIDLSKVIGYSRDSLQSRALMRSIMLDLYPGKTREMNVLLDVYESGVPRKIKNDGNITDAKYAQYIQKIVDDYGMQEQWAVVGLNAWIDVCLGNGISSRLSYKKKSFADDNVNTVGDITNPIKHNAHTSQDPTITGSISDYEIAGIGNNEFAITKFIGFDQEKTIVPNQIDGKKIVAIDKDAYKACAGIKSLIVAEGITSIGDGAFSDCKNLQSITLPTTLKSIGSSAFSSTAVTKLNLPNEIKEIPYGMCSYCKNLQSVLLPDYLVKIESRAFANSGLRKIQLPNTVKEINNAAFSTCQYLVDVDLNEGLESIGEEAFEKCSALVKITIPSTVIKFGRKIFQIDIIRNLNVIISCYPGSRAIEYARTNNLKIENAKS